MPQREARAMLYVGAEERNEMKMHIRIAAALMGILGAAACSDAANGGSLAGAADDDAGGAAESAGGGASDAAAPDGATPARDAGGAASDAASAGNDAGADAAPDASGADAGAPSGLVFDDEFDALAWYDKATGKGAWSPTGLANPNQQGEPGWGAEFDINPLTTTLGINPYSVAGGVLTITTDVAPDAIQGQISNFKYTSGAMRTVEVQLGYGYYEMRAQLPSGNGMWPAFWLLPADGAWPPEIDIFEVLGNSPTTLFTTVHTTQPVPGYTEKFADNHYSIGGSATVADTTAAFHTYGLDYRADKITWYFDGAAKFSAATPPDLVNRAVYVVIDNALGGWNGNAVDSTTPFPARYAIDYVRVYENKP